jgi:hypothetical protein
VRQTTIGDLRGDDAEGILSICRSPSHARKGGVERCPRYARRRASTPHLGGHAHTPARLCQGLDGTPSAAPAPSAGWAARGLIIEVLAPASQPCSDGTAEQQNSDNAVEVR